MCIEKQRRLSGQEHCDGDGESSATAEMAPVHAWGSVVGTGCMVPNEVSVGPIDTLYLFGLTANYTSNITSLLIKD